MNIILVIAGILLFGYSFYVHVIFFSFVKETRFWKWWGALLLLQLLFVAGYIVFAYWLIAGTGIVSIDFFETLVSFVFFFGAIFVCITISLIYSTVSNLVKEKEEVQMLQTEKITLLKNKETELEEKVLTRNEELNSKLTELERINKLMVDRELVMVELKKELNELRAKEG